MTELEAVRILRSPLSGPSARFDAERELVLRRWPALAIRLAKGDDIGSAGSAEPKTPETMTVRGFTPVGRPFSAQVPYDGEVGAGSELTIQGLCFQVVAVGEDGTVHVGRGYCR